MPAAVDHSEVVGGADVTDAGVASAQLVARLRGTLRVMTDQLQMAESWGSLVLLCMALYCFVVPSLCCNWLPFVYSYALRPLQIQTSGREIG